MDCKILNQAAEKLLGVTSKDIVGKNIWEEFSAIIPEEFYTVYHKAFLQDALVHFKVYWGERVTGLMWSVIIAMTAYLFLLKQ